MFRIYQLFNIAYIFNFKKPCIYPIYLSLCRSPPTITVTEATPEWLAAQRDVDYFDQTLGFDQSYGLEIEAPPDDSFEEVYYESPPKERIPTLDEDLALLTVRIPDRRITETHEEAPPQMGYDQMQLPSVSHQQPVQVDQAAAAGKQYFCTLAIILIVKEQVYL